MIYDNDQRNSATGHTEQESGELGDHSQVVLCATIEAQQWEAVKADPAQAAAFVAWLASHTTGE